MFCYQFYVHHLQHFHLPTFCWIKWCIPITATSLHAVSQDRRSIKSKHPDLKVKQWIFNLALVLAWARISSDRSLMKVNGGAASSPSICLTSSLNENSFHVASCHVSAQGLCEASVYRLWLSISAEKWIQMSQWQLLEKPPKYGDRLFANGCVGLLVHL